MFLTTEPSFEHQKADFSEVDLLVWNWSRLILIFLSLMKSRSIATKGLPMYKYERKILKISLSDATLPGLYHFEVMIYQ